jgi:steroid delta-isomerase-like uncharacterized protein
MSGTENKAMVRRIFEAAINAGDDAVIGELLAADYVNYDTPAPAPGPEGFKQVFAQFRAAFPDMKVTIEDEFADGDLAGTRGRFTGTHQGEFMGIPASGKPIDVKYIDLWRVRGGKLAENWVQMDMAGLMQQIGAMPGA